jgi:putative transcriptional regulator
MKQNLRIVQWRKQRGLTQQDLAKKCKTTQQTIAKVEQGLVDPKLSTLENLAKALDCEMGELFYTKDGFAKDVNAVVKKLDLDLSKIRPMDLNQLCWGESFIPTFHPLWSRYKVKDNRIFFEGET